jgi:hypothetical protein
MTDFCFEIALCARNRLLILRYDYDDLTEALIRRRRRD